MIAYIKEKKITGLNYISNDGGGSGDCDLDFTQIGYEGTPQRMIDAIEYAKEIQSNWDASVTRRNSAFEYDTELVYFPAVDTSNVTSMYRMFFGCTNLQIVPHLDTSNVTDMYYMFYYCQLTSIDISNWNVSNVTRMSSMFHDCMGLTSLDLSGWNVSNVTEMGEMFGNCVGLTSLNLSDWNTSKVTKMGYMFTKCQNLTSLDLSGWNTSNVTDMGLIFQDCKKLQSVNGSINVQSIKGTINNSYFVGYGSNSSLRKITLFNIGYNSNNTSCDFAYIQNWGVNSDEVLDARQSLIDSLLTNSFDRATAGYSTCTIKLHANSKATLTEEEIAQITAKGYTIA